ncbi:hypothetical protein [Microcoleus sp. EPA2]|uniref:hypothetical protein n=1 Tax=Microcoleus sp. EPA2 TaxID=2841654 RepID=UPI00312BC814
MRTAPTFFFGDISPVLKNEASGLVRSANFVPCQSAILEEGSANDSLYIIRQVGDRHYDLIYWHEPV